MRVIAGMARSCKSAPAQGSLLLKSQQKSPAIAGLFSWVPFRHDSTYPQLSGFFSSRLAAAHSSSISSRLLSSRVRPWSRKAVSM